MKHLLGLVCAAAVLAGCAANSAQPNAAFGSANRSGESASATAGTLDAYKLDLAQRIAAANADKISPGRPQAMLRSVVVVKYVVDGNGKLLRAQLMRSNRDRVTEATALASLRSSAPFPRPAAHLLQHGRVELAETWLFNDDGRFQLRTIAQPQMDH